MTWCEGLKGFLLEHQLCHLEISQRHILGESEADGGEGVTELFLPVKQTLGGFSLGESVLSHQGCQIEHTHVRLFSVVPESSGEALRALQVDTTG